MPLFYQYLNKVELPVLEYDVVGKGRQQTVRYRLISAREDLPDADPAVDHRFQVQDQCQCGMEPPADRCRQENDRPGWIPNRLQEFGICG